VIDDLAAAVDQIGAARHAGSADAFLGLTDDAFRDQQVAHDVEIARWIDDPGVGEQDRKARRQHDIMRSANLVRAPSCMAFGKFRGAASRTAMRTATPISTCSRINDCAPSATIESISTPRFIGPGGMTMSRGFAYARFF